MIEINNPKINYRPSILEAQRLVGPGTVDPRTTQFSTRDPDESLVKNIFGQPVVGYTILEMPESYIDFEGNTVEPPRPIILRNSLVEVTSQTNVVQTGVQGRPGKVKEYVSTGDYNITIRGIIERSESIEFDSSGKSPDNTLMPGDNLQHENEMPDEQLTILSEYKKLASELGIENQFLNSLGVTLFVCTEFSFKQKRGVYNQVEYLIRGVSDDYSDLLIIPGQS